MDLIEKSLLEAEQMKTSAIEQAKAALIEKFLPNIENFIEEELFSDEEILQETKQPTSDGQKEDDYTDDGDDGTPSEGKKNEMEDEDEDAIEEEIDAILAELDSEEGDEEISESELNAFLSTLKEEKEDMEEQDDEEISESELASALKSILEQDDEDYDDDEDYEESKKVKKENANLKSKLKEAYTAIGVLREKINEVSLLNSKLLYVSKLFKTPSLSEAYKTKILDLFDKAQNLREVKLVYTSIASDIQGKNLPIKESAKSYTKFGSDVIAGVGKNTINESTNTNSATNRFRELAGLSDPYRFDK